MIKMKAFCLSAAIAISLFACTSETKKAEDKPADATTTSVPTSNVKEEVVKDANAPVMTFKESEFDFGTIQAGDVVKHTFTFTNTGKKPLIVQNATAPCGCTVPDWTKEPVAPGATGEIRVEFNSRGKSGTQNKVVSITANTQPEMNTVTIKANVDAEVASMNGPVKK